MQSYPPVFGTLPLAAMLVDLGGELVGVNAVALKTAAGAQVGARIEIVLPDLAGRGSVRNQPGLPGSRAANTRKRQQAARSPSAGLTTATAAIRSALYPAPGQAPPDPIFNFLFRRNR
jgi:hypothetical protein